MPGEKKHWRLPTPFRRFSGKQDLRQKSEVGHSRSRVSSVYLSGDTSTNGFIVVPEFDDAARTQTTHEESNHASQLPQLSAVTSSNPLSPDGVDGYLHDLKPIGFHYSSYLGGGFCNTSVANPSWDDDLSQRLGSAYEHIRSMPSAASPTISLSSDPQMLRKQLGVPQHSVLNYPIHSSLDLPNPHASPRDAMSPKLPSAASPDVLSHAKTSKKLGLCINTNVYPISPRSCFSDLFQPAQRKSVVVPALTENSPSQCRTLEVPWSAGFACTPKHQSPTSNSSKLVKRRVERPVISSSFLPSSCRQTLRNVLRKPAADTTPSTNAQRWQISLPQIRPPSPFKVDIPLHHKWRDRRTEFNSSSECHPKIVQFHQAKSQRTSGSTEVLASLAWIGTPPMSSSSYTANRRPNPENPAFLPDRLSVAIAVEDDSMSDDALVDRLEKVRRTGGPFECGRDVSPSESSDNAHFPSVGDDNGLLPLSCSSPPNSDQVSDSSNSLLPSPVTTQDTVSDSEDAEVWQVARKALLCIREIVRTEKKYQEALKMLLNAQTATPPPPSMAPYILALVRASETLLKYFLEDPSAWGVSTAFVTSEDELEATMVSWCTVVGTFFMDGSNPQSSGLIGRWRLRKSGVISSPSSSVTKQRTISPSPQLPPMISTSSKIKELMDKEYSAWQYPRPEQERKATSVSLQMPESTNSQVPTGLPPSRKVSVRDLAIQPIQRVMRYVLLYRDLLDCTPPTSPSRLLVERALEAATRIANHCDRAQRNPAFFHAS